MLRLVLAPVPIIAIFVFLAGVALAAWADGWRTERRSWFVGAATLLAMLAAATLLIWVVGLLVGGLVG